MDENTMDKMVEVAILNLFTTAKKNENTIRLTNFSFKKKSHLAILSIAQMAHSLFGFNVKLNIKPLEYFFYNLKYKFKNTCMRTRVKNGIDTEEFIRHIEDSNYCNGIFEKIYTNYYERKKK